MDQQDKAQKPRTAPQEVRRKQLIEATITCISRYGISGTTLKAIANEADLSLGLANFHFKSKEMLMTETLRHLANEHREMWMKEVHRDDLTPLEKLQAIVQAQFHVQICSRKKLAVWFAFFGESAHRKAYREITSQIDMERQEVCGELCKDIVAEGAFPGTDAETIALTLEGIFDGLWLNILLYPAKFNRKRARRQAMDYLEMVFPVF